MDFRQALTLLSTVPTDLPTLRSAISTLGATSPSAVLPEVQTYTEAKRTALSAALATLILRNEAELEGLCAAFSGSEILTDCIPAALWVLLAGATKRYIEPFLANLSQTYHQGPAPKQLKIPLTAEDRLIVVYALLQKFMESHEQRSPTAVTTLLELFSSLHCGLGDKPGAPAMVQTELSEEIVSFAVLSTVRIAKDREERTRVLASLGAYATRRLFASAILAVKSIRQLEEVSTSA